MAKGLAALLLGFIVGWALGERLEKWLRYNG